MVLGQLFLNFRYGNKGAILLLDSIVALFLVSIILSVAVLFITRAEKSPISGLQASRIANDIFALLDYNGILRKFEIFEGITFFIRESEEFLYSLHPQTTWYPSLIFLTIGIISLGLC